MLIKMLEQQNGISEWETDEKPIQAMVTRWRMSHRNLMQLGQLGSQHNMIIRS
jgi:hypothetical protein